MLELSTPVVKLWDGILALPMIGTLDSARTQVVMETLLQRIVETGADIAIIDITGVPTVDTLTAQHLLKTVTAARLMGADCIISGIRPQIAQTIVHLGVDLGDVTTKATLADAFRRALDMTGQRATVSRATRLTGGRAMERIPILKLGDLLLVTIQVDMHDRLAMPLQDDLTTRISETGARGVLIDISSLDIVDSFIGRMIANIAAMARVLDAQTVVVGMQPAVAITLVELGLSLPGVRTALNVEKGMALLEAMPGQRTQTEARAGCRRHGLRRCRRPLGGRRRLGPPGRARAGRSRSDSAWWTRPRSSPRRASSRATRSTTAAAEVALELLDRRHATRTARRVRGQRPGHRGHREGADGRLHDG